MVSVLVDIAPPVGKNRTGYACKTPHRPPPFRTIVTGRSGTVTARSGRPQNRSRSIGMIGHDRPESPVTTRRNQRSRAAGIRTIAVERRWRVRESFCIAGLLLVLIVGPIGCTITDGATVLLGPQRAAIDVGEVRLYRAAPPKYEEIALLTAKAGHDFKNDQSLMDSAIQRLKEDAAKLGANGVLLQDVRSRSRGIAATGAGESYNEVTGIAIFVP